ncbi:MAG: phosphate signaling complex protein PhoU [Oscillospiraceae bacterium]
MRAKFDEQLALLNRELISMGASCEEAIASVAKALVTGDLAIAGKVAAIDAEIDRIERQIESLCLKLLLQQQPVARDLRLISAALKMITDMERIGDQAADIAEIVGFLNGRTGAECSHISDMARAVVNMMTNSIDAFVNRDLELANSVIEYDDIVDELFTKVKSSLISMISAAPDDGEYALDLLMIAKYFERIGDHAVNIGEWVVFSVTGVHKGESEL